MNIVVMFAIHSGRCSLGLILLVLACGAESESNSGATDSPAASSPEPAAAGGMPSGSGAATTGGAEPSRGGGSAGDISSGGGVSSSSGGARVGPCAAAPCEAGVCVEEGETFSCIEGNPYDNPDVSVELALRIDRSRRFQSFDGLGAGMIFYQNHLLNGVPSEQRDDFYDAVFGDVNHQYLMFWIRPTEETNDNDDPMVINLSAFEFPSNYARVLAEAQERDEDLQIVATVMTPPIWLKTNGALNGLNGGTLDASVENAYEEYAEFIFAGLLTYKELGVSVDAITLTNEPDWALGHEDAVYTPAQAAAVYHYTVDHLSALVESPQNTASVVMPKIMAPSTLSVTQVDDYVQAFKADGVAWENVDWVSTHQYGGGNDYENFVAANGVIDGKPFIMSEWHSANGGDVDDEVEEVMEQSNAMITAFNGMVSSYWWFELGHPNNPPAGLCHTPWGESFNCDKTYDHWRQWSQLTPVGSVRVAVDEPSPTNNTGALSYVAFDNGSSVVVHFLNRSEDAAAVSFQVEGESLTLVQRWDTGELSGYDEQTVLLPNAPRDPVVLEMPARTARSLRMTY